LRPDEPSLSFAGMMFKKLLGPSLSVKIGWLGSFAAALAFYFILCLVPFLVVTMSVMGNLFSVDIGPQVAIIISEMIPPESRIDPQTVLDSVKKGSGSGLMTVSFLLAVWTSTNFMNELARAIHFIFAESMDDMSGGWARRVKSFILLLVWVLALIVTALLLVVAPIVEWHLSHLRYISSLAMQGWALAHYGLAFFLMFVAVYLTYRLVPTRPIPWRLVCQGCWIAVIGWLGTSFVFAKVMPAIWAASAFKGALSSILATLFWAYSCAWSLLLGACWIERWRGKKQK